MVISHPRKSTSVIIQFRRTFKMPYLPISAEFENHVTTKHGIMVRYLTFIPSLRAADMNFVPLTVPFSYTPEAQTMPHSLLPS